mgnify:FL=1
MARMQNNQGAFDTSLTLIANKSRRPVFVDNAVHFAKVEPRSSGKSRVTVEQRNAETYYVATEKSYSLVESESAVTISHKETDGHTLKTQLWSTRGNNLNTPLMYSTREPSKRLSGKSITNTGNGLRIDLRNMQGRKLSDIGFSDDSVRMGQQVDIGLRTTDLAVQLADSVTGTVTAFSLGNALRSTNTGSQRRTASNVFLAADFKNINLITALRFISRHDNRLPMYDRYGVLQYVPYNSSATVRAISGSLRLGGKDKNPVDNSENRITVQGQPVSLNENLLLTMDDRGKQQGRFDNDIVESTSPIFDASITNRQQARRVARQILKTSALFKGSITSNGHPELWDLRPGDTVFYDRDRMTVLEVSHKMSTKSSDFVFLNADIGIEGVFQGIMEGSVSSAADTNDQKGSQIQDENFSFFEGLEINVLPIVTLTHVSGKGFLIGGNTNRGRLGGAAIVGPVRKKWNSIDGLLASDTAIDGDIASVGLNKSTPIQLRGEM